MCICIFITVSLYELVEENVGLGVFKDGVQVASLDVSIVEFLPLIVGVHSVRYVMAASRLQAQMLNSWVEAILGGSSSVLPVFIENAEAQRWGYNWVWDSQNFIEGDMVPHLDWAISEDESLELDA